MVPKIIMGWGAEWEIMIRIVDDGARDTDDVKSLIARASRARRRRWRKIVNEHAAELTVDSGR